MRSDGVGERIVCELLAEDVDEALLHLNSASEDKGEDPVGASE